MRKILIFLAVVTIICNTGCTTLRKKFVRKKGPEKEAPVYVDFKEYSKIATRETYVNYYIFFRGWLDDLIAALDRGLSYKRSKRAINEAITNLSGMITFYNTEGKDKIYPFQTQLLTIKEEVLNSPNASSIKKNSLIRKIARFKRNFEKNFNYKDAKKLMQINQRQSYKNE